MLRSGDDWVSLVADMARVSGNAWHFAAHHFYVAAGGQSGICAILVGGHEPGRSRKPG